MRLSRRLASLALLGALVLPHPASAAEQPVLVFAAASMKNALDAIAAAYGEESGKSVTASYAASGALVRQIEAGAPADIFISADVKWIDYAAEKGLIQPGTKTVLAGNTLVLVAPADDATAIELTSVTDLPATLGDGRLAIGEPKSVPAGQYAEAALKTLGLWDKVAGRLAPVENVRAALALVATGEAPLGIVYATDAKAEPKVRIVATFPDTSHPTIVYPAALVTASANPDAAAFLAYAASPAGQKILGDEGFSPAPPAR